MKEFKDLTNEQKQSLTDNIKELQEIAKVYRNFGGEYRQAIKSQPDNVHTYLINHFNDLFSVAQKYGIGSGIMSFDSVQNNLNSIANSIKRLSVYPNATLHQVIDDITTVATDFDGKYDHWLNNVNGVVQDGRCLTNDIDEIKNSFKVTD